MNKNVSELITSKGYPVEEYTVQTADGYLLGVQRIPHGRNGQRDADKKPVLVQHGLLASSTGWVENFPAQSLGFILADAGYDVWLGNTRGNTYSKRHVKYTTDDAEFWDFSFNEMGEYDLPAMIDHVLKETGQEKLFYIGHSQGTAAAFVLLSESQEYNEKIQLFVALAPVAFVGHMTSPIRYLTPFAGDIQLGFNILGVKEFAPSDGLVHYLSELACVSPDKSLCENVAFLLVGEDRQQLNETRLGVYSAHIPAGTSVKSLVHYAQLVVSKKFAKYDYGLGNLHHYKRFTPPEYDLSRVAVPVALLWSQNDILADPKDVAILRPKLKSVADYYRVPLPIFNHYDFVLALRANTLVYGEIMRLLEEYQ